jgi:hypothetical protein
VPTFVKLYVLAPLLLKRGGVVGTYVPTFVKLYVLAPLLLNLNEPARVTLSRISASLR